MASLERFSKSLQRFRIPTPHLSPLLRKVSHTSCRHPHRLITARILIRRLDQQLKATRRCRCLMQQHRTDINLPFGRSMWSSRAAREVWTQQASSRPQNECFIQICLRVEPLRYLLPKPWYIRPAHSQRIPPDPTTRIRIRIQLTGSSRSINLYRGCRCLGFRRPQVSLVILS